MASKFIGDHHGDGSNLTNVNANLLDGLDSGNLYRTVSSANATAGAGWVTVATKDNSRHHSEVIVTDGESSDHSFIRIDWMTSYADTNFTVLNVGGHANRITGVRVLYETADVTYGRKYLQVYVTTSSNYYVRVNKLADTPNYGNISAVTPVTQNTITGYALHGNELTGLDMASLAAEEGIKCGGSIVAGGDVTAYSDERLKENIELIPNALDKVEELRGVTFTRKSDGSESTGLIAQDLQAVLPQAVDEDSTGMLSVAYGNVVGLLVEAIKEQNSKMAEMQKEIEELRNGK